MAISLFGRTKQLESEIGGFLDVLGDANLAFKQALSLFLQESKSQRFTEKLHQVADLETRGDELRRKILTNMYAETLMPDARGDILKLLESLDDIINKFEETLWYFETEVPDIPEGFHAAYQELADLSCAAVEALVLASRAFFRDAPAVKDHMHKVLYYEKESDEVVTKLRGGIFASDLPLSNKIHLRFFAERIVWIADTAEDIADELSIYAIKRAT
jgi:predicted phosphate transport protein (TIGR00153 family)